MNQNNAVVLIAAHNTKALGLYFWYKNSGDLIETNRNNDHWRDYLYPSRRKAVDKSSSPWEKYEQIGDVDEQIRENLKKLATDQLNQINTGLMNIWIYFEDF